MANDLDALAGVVPADQVTGRLTEAGRLAEELSEQGISGVVLYWADNNGIPRSRTVPIQRLPRVAEEGVGVTVLFAVFDSHDAITHSYGGLSTASGERRIVPDLSGLRTVASAPGLAYAPVDQYRVSGEVSEYDQRAALRRQVERAEQQGVELRFGYEIEFSLFRADGSTPAHSGPAYSPHALTVLGDFQADLLRAFAETGLELNQVHAEYGLAQLEVSLRPAEPLRAADEQLLARQIIHGVAHRHGYRVSFAPLVTAEGVGNGWHVHVSPWREGRNLLAPAGDGSDVHGLGREGAAFLAGLHRNLPALSAVGAPSVPSLLRLRPGYFAGAHAIWGVENREAPLRLAEGGGLLGEGQWNIEFKASDASANPYLLLAALISAGLSGLADGAAPPPPVAEDPGTWTEEQRAERGIGALPTDPEDADAAIDDSAAVSAVFTPEHREAFRAVRASDVAWADGLTDAEIVAGHLWLY